jgi:diguanylate cyclase (GGDEF)-like protein/PAS domain S-box-containing protein
MVRGGSLVDSVNTNDQHRYLAGLLGASLLIVSQVIWLAFGAVNHIVPWPLVWANALWSVLITGGGFALIRSGANQRFRDPSLTKPIVLAAILCVLGSAHFLNPDVRPSLLPWMIVAFTFVAVSGGQKFLKDLSLWVITLTLLEGLAYGIKHGHTALLIWQMVSIVGAIACLTYYCGKTNARRSSVLAELSSHHTALSSMADAVVSLSILGEICDVNPAAALLLGADKKSLIGQKLALILQPHTDKDEAILSGLSKEQSLGQSYRSRVQIKANPGGRTRLMDLECIVASVHNPKGRFMRQVVVMRDVSETATLLRKLEHDANHDELTGTWNRRGFQTALARSKASFKHYPQGTRHALLIIDLDQFKLVNDTGGHAAGDSLLIKVTRIIQDCLTPEDHLSRYGGDEFAVIMPSVGEAVVMARAEQIRQCLEQLHFQWHSRRFPVGASIGCVMFGEEDIDMAKIMRQADSALYLAKELGRGRVQLYSNLDDQISKKSKDLAWASKVSLALDQNAFELHAQLIASFDDSKEEHFEVLIRLRDDDGSLVAPGEFMPSAERFNLMPALDRWVVRQTLKQLSETQAALGSTPHISINLSPHSIRDQSFAHFLVKELKQCAVPKERICFELTETVAISDFDVAKEFMKTIRALGCKFSLDDVGAGFNSFSYLKELTFDQIKIDGHYIRNLDRDPVDRALVESLVRAAESLGLTTVAEMVETNAIADHLHEIGVVHLQGFVIHRPEPLHKILSAGSSTDTEFKRQRILQTARAKSAKETAKETAKVTAKVKVSELA